jgi:hypothetical protein
MKRTRATSSIGHHAEADATSYNNYYEFGSSKDVVSGCEPAGSA